MRRPFLTISESHVFNLLKYGGFFKELAEAGFELKETTNNHFCEYLHNYQTHYNNEYILDLILIGDHYNVLDQADNDFISRLAGYSDRVEFVPHLMALRLTSYLSEKSDYKPNDNYTVSYNIPKKYCLAFNYDIYDLVEASIGGSIFRSINNKFEDLKNKFESEYSKSDYHYNIDERIVYRAYPRMMFPL